ncbi:hypothetical protein G3O06_04925 [Burkholderia sp. Ac-20345]|uniref:hypothetical protein n=1 Tax=Burkholderia sp. Ac-20345 TaxID=2703891 RepID=UPI00197B82DE|nr:hypothetical protein [Burkholderia sp. Ac-20345]MBN3776914.1 hypothetical protein [Burkholderia sp. Ac-20345]
MYDAKTATDYVKGAFPYKFDRIEVTGGVFSGPPPGDYLMADFQRPREPVSFCLLGEWYCDYPSGPHLGVLAHMVAEIVGGGGFYGLAGARRIS